MKRLLALIILNICLLVPNVGQANNNHFTFELYGETGQFKPKENSYLARRVALTPGTEQFNLAESDNSADFRGYGAALSYNLKESSYLNYNATIFGAASISNMYDDKSFGILDPDGLSLLIPGVGVGPNGEGYELPAPTNQTANTEYKSEYDKWEIDLGIKSNPIQKNRFSFAPYTGLQYSRFESDTQFAADVPLFIRSFAYNTNIEVDTISPFIGMETRFYLTNAISLIGDIKYLYNINFGEGDDNLDFTGFTRQTTKMDNDENTHSAEVKAGVNFALTPTMDLSFTAQYGRYGNIPTMENRTGLQKSDFNYETGQIITGAARLTLRF